MSFEPLRVLYAREHTTIFPGFGVFLAGPTPPDGQMANSWRRKIAQKLQADTRLGPHITLVLPEPRSGRWADITTHTNQPQLDAVLNKQIPWEWQYLALCHITVFWLATYWSAEQGQELGGNIGPTSRWEFGYYLQEYLHHPQERTFIVGSPADAESVKWAQRRVLSHGLEWHTLPAEDKHQLVPDTLIEAIAQALLGRVNPF